jgi:16S rRNA (guanine966-N2)-methyltransferase
MRVISGEARGRTLKAPRNESRTRPMADKIREAAFSSMDSFGIEPERVLDLYAGSGAVGIEALSRGASEADFVDRDRVACQAVRDNLRVTGFTERARVHQMAVDAFIRRVSEPYDLVILDPPYADPAIVDTIQFLGESAAVGADTVLLLGHWPRLDIPERIGRFGLLRQRCHGDSCFAIFEARNDEQEN